MQLKPNNTAEKYLYKYIEALICNRRTLGNISLNNQIKMLEDTVKLIKNELEVRKGGY